jgi:hypothetical protein
MKASATKGERGSESEIRCPLHGAGATKTTPRGVVPPEEKETAHSSVAGNFRCCLILTEQLLQSTTTLLYVRIYKRRSRNGRTCMHIPRPYLSAKPNVVGLVALEKFSVKIISSVEM